MILFQSLTQPSTGSCVCPAPGRQSTSARMMQQWVLVNSVLRRFVCCLVACCALSWAQAARPDIDPLASGQPYVLGPGDEFTLRVPNSDEISGKPFRITPEGNADLPLLGTLHLAGLTVEQVQKEVAERLKTYVREPEVSLTMTQFRAETVTLSGAFARPGIYHLQGKHTLTEVLAAAGGLGETASRVLQIVRQNDRGPLGLENARLRADGTASIGQLDISLVAGKNPADDFVLQPFDVITAFPLQPIVVGGEITHPGIVPLNGRASLPLMEAIFLSGGVTRDASLKHIKIFRRDSDSHKNQELDIDLARIETGKTGDVQLLPNDLVVVPHSTGKLASRQVIAISTGIALTAVSAMMMTR